LQPQLSEIRADIHALDAKLSGRIGSLGSRLSGRIDASEGRAVGLEAKMDRGFRAIHSEVRRLDMNERLVAVGAKVRELETKR